MTKEHENMQQSTTTARSRVGRRSGLIAAAIATALTLASATPASAAAGPVWDADVSVVPTHIAPGGTGMVAIEVYNVSSTPSDGSTVTIEDALPAGVTATGTFDTGGAWNCSGTTTVTCINDPIVLPVIPSEFSVPRGFTADAVPPIRITVAADPGTPAETLSTAVKVSGGGAATTGRVTMPLTVSETEAPFGVPRFKMSAIDRDGSSATQAGEHPYALITSFTLANKGLGGEDARGVSGGPKDFSFDLPMGLVGDANAAPRCPRKVFDSATSSQSENGCPPETQIGIVRACLDQTFLCTASPVFNLEPPTGLPAQFGFGVFQLVAFVNTTVKTGDGYGLQVKVRSPLGGNLTSARMELWGNPGDASHEVERSCIVNGTADACSPQSISKNPEKPLLTQPGSCRAIQEVTMRANSWDHPDQFVSGTYPVVDNQGRAVPLDGCERLPFNPSVSVKPTVTTADSPSGLHVALTVPQNGSVDGLASAILKRVAVTLPEGVSVSPSAADGLGACSPVQIGLSDAGEPTCPDSSKIGTVRIDTPLLTDPLEGSVFLARQNENPFSSVLSLYIVAQDPTSGVLVKLAGHVQADPVTGRLTTVFDDNPQLPFEKLTLDLFSGPRGALATPDACGSFTTTSQLTPWSAPYQSDATISDSFTINSGCDGGFAPAFSAGVANPSAGASSTFTLNVSRADGQQHIRTITTTLPPGVLAKVGSVALCADAEGAAGTCNVSSQLGSADAAAGPGSNPFHIAGKVYLTGPYKGAPYGLSIVVPAIAGPFNLGTVVVRAAIKVDPIDAHVTVVSDDVPNILAVKGDDGDTNGFPVRIRSIAVTIDRPGFMLNPTSCDPTSITGSIGSWEGGSAAVNSRFQIGNCSSLAVAPKLALSLTGKGQTTDDKHPGVHAVLTQTPGLANLKKVEVTLPLSLALDPDNAQALCEFADGSKVEPACPKASIVGHVSAESPILDGPLTGPVYFVKNVRVDAKTGRQIRTLPKLVIPLTGPNGLRLNLTGLSSVPDNKHLVSTFDLIPDAPVSKFTLDIDGGKHGILVVSGTNICKSTQQATQEATGQNGKVTDSTITMGTPCTLGITASTHTSTALKLTVGGLGAGKVSVSGNAITKTSRTIASATSATLTAKLTRAARTALAHHRNVTVKLTVSFTPKGAKKAKVMHKTLTIHGASKPAKK